VGFDQQRANQTGARRIGHAAQIADAEPGFATEAVAAQVAGAIDLGARLAGELGQPEAKYISLEFDTLNVVLAPFGDELLLALVGEPSALTCECRLNTTGA